MKLKKNSCCEECRKKLQLPPSDSKDIKLDNCTFCGHYANNHIILTTTRKPEVKPRKKRKGKKKQNNNLPSWDTKEEDAAAVDRGNSHIC